MIKKAQQWYWLTEEGLGKLLGQGTHPGADTAFEHVQKIRGLGHTSAIYWSEFNGFLVLDEDDNEQFQKSLSIKNRSKQFYI